MFKVSYTGMFNARIERFFESREEAINWASSVGKLREAKIEEISFSHSVSQEYNGIKKRSLNHV